MPKTRELEILPVDNESIKQEPAETPAAAAPPVKAKKRKYTMTEGRAEALRKANEARLQNKLRRESEKKREQESEQERMLEEKIARILEKRAVSTKPASEPAPASPRPLVPVKQKSALKPQKKKVTLPESEDSESDEDSVAEEPEPKRHATYAQRGGDGRGHGSVSNMYSLIFGR